MDRTWNLSGWSLAYFAVLLLVVLDLFDIIDMPWFIWWPVLAVAVAGALAKWGRMNGETSDSQSVGGTDKQV